ncbi:MAG: hypothetical protein HYR60_06660 [Acidobacteria bacterium]|nr:hypothetical protein [Acidobacteriota bacterium]
MTILALIWGILALCGMFVAFFPCLGSLNWLNIPFSVVGLIVSLIALLTSKDGNKGGAIAGVVMCAVAALLGIIRLVAGGGIL